METLEVFERNVEDYEKWYRRYPNVYESEVLALRRHFAQLPENISGIEVGLGTGRFAEPLGIKEGVEPAENMRAEAIRRGVSEVMDASAEHLPYKDLHFDFVLFVTVCHLENVSAAFKEANRVLKKGGSVIVGFIDKDRAIAGQYEAKRDRSTFYRQAQFLRVDQIEEELKSAGFKDFVYTQTLFGKLNEIDEVQEPKDGYGEGSFVIVRATKK